MNRFTPDMKKDTVIHFYKRCDRSSLDYVGQRVYEQMVEHAYNVELKFIDKVNLDSIIKPVDIGMMYGLIRDLKKISRYPVRIAGLVCEEDLTPTEIMLIKEADLTDIWVPSNYVAQFFIKAGLGDRVTIMPHGVDDLPIVECKSSDVMNGLMIFNSYSRPNNHVLRKNPFKTIEAFNLLGDDQKVRLKMKTKFQKYYEKVRLDKVDFIQTYFEDLGQLYETCNFTIYASESEGFGLVGLESLIRGVPLISTKTGNDYLDDEVNYIKVELPVTAEKIKTAINEIISNYSFHRKQALKQRDALYAKNSWPTVGGKINVAMEKVLCRMYGIN